VVVTNFKFLSQYLSEDTNECH